MARKLPYTEGTWFAVPLRNGGFGAGIIARHSRNGCILIYLFGPKRKEPPKLAQFERLTKADAIKAIIAGDLGLIEGSWPIIGKCESWRRDDWPMPKFLRANELSPTVWLVTYADDNPNKRVSEERVPFETTGFERDGLYGAGAVEIVLTRLLS